MVSLLRSSRVQEDRRSGRVGTGVRIEGAPRPLDRSGSGGHRIAINMVSARQRGGLEAPSEPRLSGETQAQDPSECSQQAPSSVRHDHQIARWHESLSACGNRQLLEANLVLVSPSCRERLEASAPLETHWNYIREIVTPWKHSVNAPTIEGSNHSLSARTT